MSSVISFRNLVGVAAAAVIAFAVGDSQADTKVFPGSFCVSHGYLTPPTIWFSYNILGVSNITTSTKGVICPAVRDNELATMDITDWDITVNRNGATAAWTVQLCSQTTDGLTGTCNTITVPAGAGIKELDGGAITTAFAGGVVFLLSDMPPNARLARYQITESD